MSATKYLDYDGLLYFWGKLKALFNNKADKATTLSGYGITDAKIASGTITLGSNTITPLTSSSSLSASKITGQVAVANGGSGLSASPSMLTNLESTTAADVMQASPRPGVTGVLPVANGGTGHAERLTETTAEDFNTYITTGEYHVRYTNSTLNPPQAISSGALDCILVVKNIGAAASVSDQRRTDQIAYVQNSTYTNRIRVFLRKRYSTNGTWSAWSEVAFTDSDITGNAATATTAASATTAATASKVANKLTIKVKTGTTEGTDLYTYDGSGAKTLDIKQGSNITLTAAAGQLTIAGVGDTKNTAGSTDSSSKLFLIGATSQAVNPQTYSHDTAYVGTDGCLYSGGTKVLTAHQNISGKADKATTLAGYGITDAYTKTEVDTKLTSAMHYKGSVATVADLPSSNNQTGDFYNVTATGENYAWTGSAWDVTGSIIDLAAITNSEIDTVVAS